MTGHAAFDDLLDAFNGLPGVEPPTAAGRGFGAQALRVQRPHLCDVPSAAPRCQTSSARVTHLIADAIGSSFDAGKGRPMREWLTVEDHTPETWLRLSREAYDFVSGPGGPSSERHRIPRHGCRARRNDQVGLVPSTRRHPSPPSAP
jgi:hypothetical protein